MYAPRLACDLHAPDEFHRVSAGHPEVGPGIDEEERKLRSLDLVVLQVGEKAHPSSESAFAGDVDHRSLSDFPTGPEDVPSHCESGIDGDEALIPFRGAVDRGQPRVG